MTDKSTGGGGARGFVIARIALLALVAPAACHEPARALLVVSLTSTESLTPSRIEVRVTTANAGGMTKQATAKFNALDGGVIPSTGLPATVGVTVPGDVGSVVLEVDVFVDGSSPRATGTSKPIVVRAGATIPVAVMLTLVTPSSQSDASTDGAAEGADGGSGNDAGAGDAAPADELPGTDVAPGADAPADVVAPDAPIDRAPDHADAAGPVDLAPEVNLPPPELNTNLIAWWKMDEDSASYTAHDNTKHGNDATLNDLFSGVAWVMGHVGTAFRPAGGGWLSTKESASFDALSDHISVSVWVNPANELGIHTVLQRQRATGAEDDFWLGFVNNHLSWRLGTSATLEISAILPTDQWAHVAVTNDGITMKIYVNGVVVSQNASGAFMSKQLRGFNISASCHDADATIIEWPSLTLVDDLLIYNRALALQDVIALAHDLRPDPP